MLSYINAIYTDSSAAMLNPRAIKFANISENKVLANNSELTVALRSAIAIKEISHI